MYVCCVCVTVLLEVPQTGSDISVISYVRKYVRAEVKIKFQSLQALRHLETRYILSYSKV